MNNDFIITYTKYNIAIEKNDITDELRNEFCQKLANEPIREQQRLIGLILNAILKHGVKNKQIEAAKIECLKLNLGVSVPNFDIFEKILDFLLIDRFTDFNLQIEKIKEIFNYVNKRDENLNAFNKGILLMIVNRLMSLSTDDGETGISANPDLANNIVEALENLDDVNFFMTFMTWYSRKDI